MDLFEVLGLLLAATAAGWVDAVVGGGGVLLIPVLLLSFPQYAPATALGTNKIAAVMGTATAAYMYQRRTRLDRSVLVPAAALAVPFGALGALSAASVPTGYFRPVIMALLISVALFVAFRPSFGVQQTERIVTRRRRIGTILLAGVVIGFYDGVFGPGVGTFLIISFTTLLATQFLESAAMAKVINASSNLGALAVFAWQGNVLWAIGLGMAVGNITGAMIGSRTAMKKGSGFVRIVLVLVVTAMVIKMGFDQFA
ncbi:sulfite exporter TauE/SafE family protein [Streptomyces sp. NBC_00576]|uniref:sulfite exporter TauE/SafE family protein n=1 Tax=Streptomyces sp. NBC_00576 TaxID=2903665 RepID=UPI002E8060FB|nr:TSUP family transporter [Streptomyces sp. NBC_00576]WUB73295.1 TSUP family transporter [Streptomyces sp. NBC_00576]